MHCRKTLIAGAVIVMLTGGIPAASAATPPDTTEGTEPSGAAIDLALPAAKLTTVGLTVRKSTGEWWEVAVNWSISYTASDVAAQNTYKTWVDIWEDDNVYDDPIANGSSKPAFLTARAQPHNITQKILVTSGAIDTEIGDEEVYARAIAQNRKTGAEFELWSFTFVVDD
ncbi:hypothetical protein PV410_33990 [Streptomyces sp. PA03-5A]|nr:hypothetical protein [Streptomyces sp. PA03-5A]